MNQFHLVFIALVLLIFKIKPISNEIYSTTADLDTTFHLERHIVDVLKTFVFQTEEKLQIIRRFIKDYEYVEEGNTSDNEELRERVTTNPIDAYRLMRRVYIDWQLVEMKIDIDEWKSALQWMENLCADSIFPAKEDFGGAAQSLVRLQDTYELNITELVGGNVLGRQTRTKLTAVDCLFIGISAVYMKSYARAVEWMEESYILAGQEKNSNVTLAKVTEFLQNAKELHDDVLQRTKDKQPTAVTSNSALFRHPLKEKSASIQRKELILNRKYILGRNNSTLEEEDENFKALCRGEQLMDSRLLRRLSCWYDHRDQDYLRVMPIKVEQHSFDPAIYTFHNILTDSEIELMKELAQPKLAPSTTTYGIGIDEEISDYRISNTAWLNETEDPVLMDINRRISFITGLQTDPFQAQAESFQVANYGIGGHFYPHYDNLINNFTDVNSMEVPESELAMGDRIATFMFYLNDVEVGGSTAFPRIGVAVKPIKGSAVFWFNLKRNGEADPMTLHGGCPVVFGNKWVSTKWIREKEQIFHRRCSLDAEE